MGGNTKGRAIPGWGLQEAGGSSFFRKHSAFHLAEPPLHLGHTAVPHLPHFLRAPLLLCSGCPSSAPPGTEQLAPCLNPDILGLARGHAGPRPMEQPQVTAALSLGRYFCSLRPRLCRDLLQAHFSAWLLGREGCAWLSSRGLERSRSLLNQEQLLPGGQARRG